MLAAARGGQGGWSEHLGVCTACKDDVEALRRYLVAGRLPLTEPPDAWVARAIALAKPSASLVEKLERLVAVLSFDSWALPAPAGVRGLAPLNQRRLRFESGPVSLELRAEKKAQGWSFVAQAAAGEQLPITLRTGRTVVRPDNKGFFQWSAKTPPHSLILTAGDQVIELPELSWKMPKP